MQQLFKAGTQYNDFVGTVAADRSDTRDFSAFLKKRGLMSENERLVGFEIVFNENDGQPISEPGIVAFLAEGDDMDAVARERDANGFQLRNVEVFDLPLADFFAYFKRFNVMFANKSLHLDGAPYDLT